MKESIAAIWQKDRDEASVKRAETFAHYTVPTLMVDPTQSSEYTESVVHDFSSMGSFLVNNLTAKLSTALFPAGKPNFKIELSDDLKAAATQQNVSETELATRMSRLESDATERTFYNAGLSKLQRALKLIAVTGDCLIYRDTDTSKMVVWSRQSYSVKRTPTGDLMRVSLKQRFSCGSLPQEILADIQDKKPGQYQDPSQTVDLYTLIKVEQGKPNNRVEVKHEVDGVRVGPESSYPEHLSPWIVPVWNLADGEHYGRGIVEDYVGDFAKLSLLSKQLGLYELDSLNSLNLVDEAAGGVVDDYQEADTGDYVPGRVGAVTAYEKGDYQKMATIRAGMQEIFQRLSVAFMYSANMRDAERVTAQEVLQVAREADNLLGGAYSQLSGSLQAPLAYLTMMEVSPDLLMGLMSRAYRPRVVTGVPALSRASETQNLLQASQEIAAIVPVLAQADNTLDPRKITQMILSNNSVDSDALKKSPEQLQQEAQAAQQAALAQQQAAQQSLLAGAEGVTQASQSIQGA